MPNVHCPLVNIRYRNHKENTRKLRAGDFTVQQLVKQWFCVPVKGNGPIQMPGLDKDTLF